MPAQANFFYSHSYCYTYGVPHLVTGMLADYKMDENWSVQGGFHRGWSQFEDDNPSLDFLGGFRWQSSDRRTIVSYTLSSGPQDVEQLPRMVLSTALSFRKNSDRAASTCWSMTWAWKTTPRPDGGAAEWYGLNQYYIYTLNSQWAACVRAEWFRDQDGVMRSPGRGTCPACGPGRATASRAISTNLPPG